jgi:hydrogenase maturation protease
MTTVPVHCNYTAPILVLALGDVRMGDDGVGPAILADLAERYRYAGGFIEFVDGGTQGLELLSRIAGRQALVVLDAMTAGLQPGTVSVLEGSDVLRYAAADSSIRAAEGNAGEVLATAAFLGDLPYCCYVIGVEPGASGTGAGFSKPVQRSLQDALARAQNVVDRLLVELSEPVNA